MKRYPHTAIITSDNGTIVHGEYVPGSASSVTVQGRFEPTNSNSKIKLNSLGNEVIVRGTFYCYKPDISGENLVVKGLVDAKIICIEQFQTHTEIYV